MKAVIFDRDGVILDTESINIDAAVIAFNAFGITIKEEEKQWIVGRDPDDYHKLFLKKYTFSYEEFRKVQRKTYYELWHAVPLFDKATSLIKRLHGLKVPLALNTSAKRKSTEEVLRRAALENVFDVIVTSEDYKKRKPDPESYLLTAKKLKVLPGDCIVIEDSSIGVEAAKNAGMKCIAIPNQYTKNADFSKADLVVDSADKIDIALLRSL